jgi:hypothetical protein
LDEGGFSNILGTGCRLLLDGASPLKAGREIHEKMAYPGFLWLKVAPITGEFQKMSVSG